MTSPAIKLLAFFKSKPIYFFVFLIWIIGLFFRTYRQDQLLGFYYDQGRDAKMARDILTFKNLPAIGPTTGIQGLYLGPFWFYLITPGYLIGQGDPAIAAGFMAFIESLTIPALFILLSRYHNTKSAFLAAFFWSFSYYLMRSSRWFSNPTPIPLFTVILIYFLARIFVDKQPKFWPWFTLFLGLSLQLEAASAVFFIPVTLLLVLLNFKTFKLIDLKLVSLAAVSFLVLLLPQVAFEIKNKFFITTNFIGFLTGKVNSDSGKSWGIPTTEFVLNRLKMYYETLFSKLDTNTTWVSTLFFVILIIGLILIVKNLKKQLFFQIPLIWLFIPLLLLLFFVGNYGTLYDYYLTGFFPAFIILFSISIAIIFSYKYIFYPAAAVICLIFLSVNLSFTKNYITAGTDGPENIMFGNQKQAVEYICQENKNKEYNTDVYVPPVIPHPYEYLFDWYTSRNLCTPQTTTLVSNLYTYYEVDPPHPERLTAWLQRQATIGKIESETRFGGIIVQKRTRIK